jgi:hypothetical protein
MVGIPIALGVPPARALELALLLLLSLNTVGRPAWRSYGCAGAPGPGCW